MQELQSPRSSDDRAAAMARIDSDVRECSGVVCDASVVSLTEPWRPRQSLRCADLLSLEWVGIGSQIRLPPV